MVKKESAERGYMTLGEIKSKLNNLFSNSPTSDEVWDINPKRLDKIDYLEGILRRKNLLAPKTREGVYKILDNLYAQEARSEKWQYYKSGFSPSEKYHLNNAAEDIADRGKLAEKMGDYARAIKFYDRADKLNEKSFEGGSRVWASVPSKEKIEELKMKLKERGSIKQSGLGSILSRIVGAFFVGSFLGAGVFFSSTKITANVVGFSGQTSSLFGAGFVLLGIVGGFFLIKTFKK